MRTSALFSFFLLAQVASAHQAPVAGQPEDHRFQSAGLQLDGIERLSELRGKPVLIEFWGIN